jgi:ACT domain-containing protein
MRAIITVSGKDAVGIIAQVSCACTEANANIEDITQKVFEDLFVMVMLVTIDDLNIKFTEFIDRMTELGKQNGLVIHTVHEEIFNAMHRI